MSEPEESQQQYQTIYGGNRFEYRLCYVPPKSGRSKVAIHVYPNGLVQVDAPEGTPLPQIKAAVLKRARWVLTHLKAIEERNEYVLPREYVSGESLFYMGRRYVLKVRTDSDKKQVKLYRGMLRVSIKDSSVESVKSAVRQWYRERAKIVFARRLALLVPKLNWLKQQPEWKLLIMKKQWGSCSPAGLLSLNPHLVKAPTECIDYVLLHELCHLLEHNHSPYFYELLSHQMPHWESVKNRLDAMAERLLNE